MRRFHVECGKATDPAGNLFQRLVARQVDVDRGDRDVAAAHGVEIGAGAGILLRDRPGRSTTTGGRAGPAAECRLRRGGGCPGA